MWHLKLKSLLSFSPPQTTQGKQHRTIFYCITRFYKIDDRRNNIELCDHNNHNIVSLVFYDICHILVCSILVVLAFCCICNIGNYILDKDSSHIQIANNFHIRILNKIHIPIKEKLSLLLQDPLNPERMPFLSVP